MTLIKDIKLQVLPQYAFVYILTSVFFTTIWTTFDKKERHIRYLGILQNRCDIYDERFFRKNKSYSNISRYFGNPTRDACLN